jgi:hypothetical protein
MVCSLRLFGRIELSRSHCVLAGRVMPIDNEARLEIMARSRVSKCTEGSLTSILRVLDSRPHLVFPCIPLSGNQINLMRLIPRSLGTAHLPVIKLVSGLHLVQRRSAVREPETSVSRRFSVHVKSFFATAPTVSQRRWMLGCAYGENTHPSHHCL